MPKHTEYIERLIFQFNTGNISPEELEVLKDWYNSHDDQNVVVTSNKDESHDAVKSRMLAGLLEKVAAEQQQRPVKLYRKYRWMAGAAAILLVAFGTWVALEQKAPELAVKKAQTTIEPGGNKATLTLADGRTVELSSSQSGIVTGEEITYANGTPVENVALTEHSDATRMLVLHTPRGGTYKITLADGTDVWLNAASTIKYPSRFAAEGRVVELEGEAYFQVKPVFLKNGGKLPFKVISGQQVVEVLGTQFNIHAYPNASGKTTLVEGKVAISDKQSHFILAPNEQAITTGGSTRIKKVNAGNYTSWRDGKFSFDGKTFEETMSEIGRWYDLDVVYENGIPKEELIGDAFRNQNLSFVLRLLDVVQIDYKLDVTRRKLTIKGENK